MALAIGTQVNHYRITSSLGAGGMGEVYAVEDLKLGRHLALKLLPVEFTGESDRVRRFNQEARAASALNHPNIITIYEIGQSEAGHYIVMELVVGTTLREMIGQPVLIEKFSSVARQLAQALRVAHDAGITHRDIKPENIMVRSDGYVKVLDFGLARLAPSKAAGTETQTLSITADGTVFGTMLGTIRYMSPEQARGETLTNATDIFSLGIVLYEIATGRHPFEANSAIGVLQAIVSDSPLPPSRLNPELSAGVEAMLLGMLEKDQRFRPSAAELEVQLTQPGGAYADAGNFETLMGKPKFQSVGRELERAELKAGMDAIAHGRGQILCISGEPGTGKTTLIEDFLSELASTPGCRIARGRCSERLAGTEAYLPWLEALDSLLHDRRSRESTTGIMKSIAPTWYGQVAAQASDNSSISRLKREKAAPSQERLKREMVALLQELSRSQSLVMFFDDLHWADPSTVDLLAFVADRLNTLRLLIVTTHRPSDLILAKHPFAQLQQALRTRGACRDLSLELLTQDDVVRYLELRFPQNEFPSELPGSIHMKTGGNPLFMVELVRDLIDRKVIAEDAGRWKLAQPLNQGDPDLPGSVRGLIDRKMSRLQEEERQLLIAASIQGYEFDSAVIAQALDLDAADVEDHLESLERIHVLVRQIEEREFPDHTFTLRYRFVHVLYQNVLYGSSRPTRRARIAGTLARTLEHCWGKQTGKVANQLALLFETARDFARSANYFHVAASNAIGIFASQEAVALANRALAMIGKMPQGRERLEQELAVQIVLANALIATHGYASSEVEQTYARARQLCQELGETRYRLPALWGLNQFHLMKARYNEALTLGEEFLQLVELQNDPAIVIAHRVVGLALFYTGKLTQAREHFEAIVSLYVPERHRPLTWLYAQEPGLAGEALLGLTLWLLGFAEQALMHSERSLGIGREISQANSQANAHAWAAIHHQFRRESEKVRELAEALATLATEQGLRFWLAVAAIQHGWAIADQGRFEEGIEKMRSGIAGFRSAGAEMMLTLNLGLMAEQYGKVGRPQEGLTVLNEAFALAELPGNGEKFWSAELYRVKGELLLMDGAAAADVEECFDTSIAIAKNQKARFLELRAVASLSRLLARQNKRAQAHALLNAALSGFTEGFETIDVREAASLIDELAGG